MRTSQVESKVSPCFTCGNTTLDANGNGLAAPEQLSEVVSQVRTAEQSSLRESSSTSHDWKDNSKGDVFHLEAKKRGISFGEDYQIFCVIYLYQDLLCRLQ